MPGRARSRRYRWGIRRLRARDFGRHCPRAGFGTGELAGVAGVRLFGDGFEGVAGDRGDGVVARNAVARVAVGRIVQGEGRPRADLVDAGDFIAAEQLLQVAAPGFDEVRRSVDGCEDEAMTGDVSSTAPLHCFWCKAEIGCVSTSG